MNICKLYDWEEVLDLKGAGILRGHVFGHPKFPDGTMISTSPIQKVERHQDGDQQVPVMSTENTQYWCYRQAQKRVAIVGQVFPVTVIEEPTVGTFEI